MRSAITFDVDWAPDWTIALCADLCASANVPCTFFATHKTPFLGELANMPRVEIGIHPNFGVMSTHGDSTNSVMSHMLDIVPSATSMRSHSLIQATSIYEEICVHFPTIKYDSSLLVLGQSALFPFKMPYVSEGKFLTRIPYLWEDDVAALDPTWSWADSMPAIEGVNVFAFHPIHVALNTSRLDVYKALRKSTNKPLADLNKKDVEPYKNPDPGAYTKLGELLDCNPERNFSTITDLATTYAT